MPQGKAVIGQSGGPTAVINKSLVGFIKEATKSDFDEILGARHGLAGMLSEDFVDLSKLSEAQLYGMGKTCLLYTSPSPRDRTRSRMPSSA